MGFAIGFLTCYALVTLLVMRRTMKLCREEYWRYNRQLFIEDLKWPFYVS